ncbi:MAG: nucleotidyltransferase domain-containing protein [Desulfobacterales bacterium]
MAHYDSLKLEEICRRYSIDTIYSFGSRGMELKLFVAGTGDIDRSKTSDFDVAVKIPPKKSLIVREKSQLTIDLEELFQLTRLDLVVINEADPFLAANIIRGERIFCRDEYLADQYELYIFRRAGDLIPLERERLEIIFSK